MTHLSSNACKSTLTPSWSLCSPSAATGASYVPLSVCSYLEQFNNDNETR